MAKMTRAKARKRLLEAQSKFQKVYMWHMPGPGSLSTRQKPAVSTKDMEAIERIVARCINRIQ